MPRPRVKEEQVFKRAGAEVRLRPEQDFYRIEWYYGGERKREKRKTKQDGQVRAKEILAGLVVGTDVDEEAAQKSDLAYLRTLREKLGDIPLHRVVEEYLANSNRKKVQQAKTRDLLVEFLAQLEQDKASPSYTRIIKLHLDPFVQRFPGLISAVSATEIDTWVRDRASGARLRNNIRASLVTFFRWARDTKKALPEVMRTEPELVRKARDKGAHQRVQLWTPAEMREILRLAEPLTYAIAVLGAFCGIRTSEITGEETDHPPMQWEDILWDHRQIRVGWQKVDTKERRYVPMPDNVLKLLAPFQGCKGSMWLYGRSEDGFKRAVEKIRATTSEKEFAWKRNANRKSYISYRTAITRNPEQVADECGTSLSKIRSNYRRPELEADAHAWFSIGLSADDQKWIKTVWERANAHDKRQACFYEIAPFLPKS